ncbi:hypothetical protein [Ralstonia solanacearum]|uniref:Transmembrane protein n=2 Tax=Ralstonia solanacearum species complex TaxID=3116862 RepID=A0A0S4WKZ6_RALSL|nr:conserved membrane protein of unknown function [Ralstonia solanacearum]
MKDIPTDSTAQLAVGTTDRQTRKWPTSFDPLKLVAGAVAFLGIQAWVAGEVFMMGYWSAAHYPRGIAPLSAQSTALLGFCGAYRCWIWAALAIGAYGVLGFLFAVRRKGANGKPSWLKRSQHRAKMWAADKFELDAFSAIPGVVLFAAAVFYYGALISPAALWVGGANYEGKRLFEKQACQTRAGATPTSIALADGSTLKGNIIERSDKLKALLTADAVVMVADGERGARIVESTSLGNIKCADK